MIRIVISIDKDKNIQGLNISGHAGYAKKGEDIVCAGVSALTYTLLNSLKILAQIDVNCEIKNGYVNFTLPDIDTEKFEKAQLILKAIVIGYKNMRDSYKSFIEIIEEEV